MTEIEPHTTLTADLIYDPPAVDEENVVALTAAARAALDQLDHAVDAIARLVLQVQEGQLWTVTGHRSFSSWVTDPESGLGRTRGYAYELADRARFARALEEVAGRRVPLPSKELSRALKGDARSWAVELLAVEIDRDADDLDAEIVKRLNRAIDLIDTRERRDPALDAPPPEGDVTPTSAPPDELAEPEVVRVVLRDGTELALEDYLALTAGDGDEAGDEWDDATADAEIDAARAEIDDLRRQLADAEAELQRLRSEVAAKTTASATFDEDSVADRRLEGYARSVGEQLCRDHPERTWAWGDGVLTLTEPGVTVTALQGALDRGVRAIQRQMPSLTAEVR